MEERTCRNCKYFNHGVCTNTFVNKLFSHDDLSFEPFEDGSVHDLMEESLLGRINESLILGLCGDLHDLFMNKLVCTARIEPDVSNPLFSYHCAEWQ